MSTINKLLRAIQKFEEVFGSKPTKITLERKNYFEIKQELKDSMKHDHIGDIRLDRIDFWVGDVKIAIHGNHD